MPEVEQLIITFLEQWLENYKVNWNAESEDGINNIAFSVMEKSIKNTNAELANLNVQLSNLHDLLERGIYDDETFISRRNTLLEMKNKKEEVVTNLEEKLFVLKTRKAAKIDLISNNHVCD